MIARRMMAAMARTHQRGRIGVRAAPVKLSRDSAASLAVAVGVAEDTAGVWPPLFGVDGETLGVGVEAVGEPSMTIVTPVLEKPAA
jgi:hypothetical protein